MSAIPFDNLRSEARPAARPSFYVWMGGIFVPTLREEGVGTIVPAGTEMGKILDLHTLAELEVFTAPYPNTAMMLLRPEICVVEGSALLYVTAVPA